MTETRAEKAQRLVDEGGVTIIQHSPMFTMAHIASDHHDYAPVLFFSGHFYCGCEWGVFHSYTPDLCAHALAVQIVVERNER